MRRVSWAEHTNGSSRRFPERVNFQFHSGWVKATETLRWVKATQLVGYCYVTRDLFDPPAFCSPYCVCFFFLHGLCSTWISTRRCVARPQIAATRRYSRPIKLGPHTPRDDERYRGGKCEKKAIN